MRRIDVSMPLGPGMPSFPGDPPFHVTVVESLARGGPYNLSTLSFGSHAGTHLDPPRHFANSGTPTDELDLDALNGPCRVVDVAPGTGAIGPDVVSRIPAGTARVLFRTENSARWSRSPEFFPDYVGLTPDAAEALVARSVRLVGIDSLSVENDPSGAYPVHRTLLRHGVLVLEGLLLAHAAGGEYELECLPLRWTGGDGGPARAVLLAR